MTDTDFETPQSRFARAPRPLHFVRIRLRRDQAEYVKGLFEDEQEALYGELAKLRDAGKPEDHHRIAEIRDELGHLIEAIRDVSSGLIELVGEDRDPR